MSRLQNFFKKIFPASWAKSMEAESRQWMYTCPHCGHQHSIWDAGGIRWKSSRNSRTMMFAKCPQCGKNGGSRLTKVD